ncbi:hypothetical protein [Anaplasma phagocytophilum]|uniref:hypothetical protein n=1 Tax=Anaplasma phagocytophilum TaxID=948 RepID=UPI00201A6616
MFTLLRLLKFLTLSSIPRFVVELMQRSRVLILQRLRTMQRRGKQRLKQLSVVVLELQAV